MKPLAQGGCPSFKHKYTREAWQSCSCGHRHGADALCVCYSKHLSFDKETVTPVLGIFTSFHSGSEAIVTLGEKAGAVSFVIFSTPFALTFDFCLLGILKLTLPPPLNQPHSQAFIFPQLLYPSKEMFFTLEKSGL